MTVAVKKTKRQLKKYFFILSFSGYVWSTKVNLKGNGKLPWTGLQNKKGKMLTCWEYVRLDSPVNDLVQKQHARIPSYCTVIILATILTSRTWSQQRKKIWIFLQDLGRKWPSRWHMAWLLVLRVPDKLDISLVHRLEEHVH